MKLRSFIEAAKLDISHLSAYVDAGTGYSHHFEVKADDFITFAKTDFFKADLRGLVNALSNAKRAIDCQADTFITSIGLDPESLKNQLGQSGMASLNFDGVANDGPLKFRFLRALGIASPEIVGRMRRLRNLLEHEYRRPRRKDVRNAIDIAELFVQACKGRMQFAFDRVYVGSGTGGGDRMRKVEKDLLFQFEPSPKPHFEVMYLEENAKSKPPSIKVCVGEEGFMALLKLIWHSDWDRDMTEPVKAFLIELGFKIPARFRVPNMTHS